MWKYSWRRRLHRTVTAYNNATPAAPVHQIPSAGSDLAARHSRTHKFIAIDVPGTLIRVPRWYSLAVFLVQLLFIYAAKRFCFQLLPVLEHIRPEQAARTCKIMQRI